MASIRDTNGKLFFDFRYKGQRCREYTAVENNKTNRIKMEKILLKLKRILKLIGSIITVIFPTVKMPKSLIQNQLF